MENKLIVSSAFGVDDKVWILTELGPKEVYVNQIKSQKTSNELEPSIRYTLSQYTNREIKEMEDSEGKNFKNTKYERDETWIFSSPEKMKEKVGDAVKQIEKDKVLKGSDSWGPTGY